ncbi:MAG TPA: antibiotic biosynthesis monooxygenase [Chitinophagaceae bacterium]|jgi:quinol monooxygenase YgiN|nr:antibiotic biosynthesis monooxygenase [Chitinophagaceae bacterium]
MATAIDNSKTICTLINVFTVEPDKQQLLFELLKKATENVMSKQRGYLSANLHMGDDKKTVTNYAQWASLEDFKNIMKVEEVQVHMKEIEAMIIEFKPVTYNEIWTHSK